MFQVHEHFANNNTEFSSPKAVDKDNDGNISFEEFVAWMLVGA
jgi:Ca2+-binding EF-hand superfamily protein